MYDTTKIEEKFSQINDEMVRYCVNEFLTNDGDKKSYEDIIALAIKYNIKSVTDIGCAAGCQSEIFLQNNIKYIGVDVENVFYPNKKAVYILNDFKNVTTITDAAVSQLCVGFLITDDSTYKKIATDYKYFICDKVNKNILEYFEIIEERMRSPYNKKFLKEHPDNKEVIPSAYFLKSKIYK